jgi:hypothetical protein
MGLTTRPTEGASIPEPFPEPTFPASSRAEVFLRYGRWCVPA